MPLKFSITEILDFKWLIKLYLFARTFETSKIEATKSCNINRDIVVTRFDRDLLHIAFAHDYTSALLACFMRIVDEIVVDRFENRWPFFAAKYVGVGSLFSEIITSERYTNKFYTVLSEKHYRINDFVMGDREGRASCFYSLVADWCKICHECIEEMTNPTEEQEMYYSKLFVIRKVFSNAPHITHIYRESPSLNFKKAANAIKAVFPPEFNFTGAQGENEYDIWHTYHKIIDATV